NNAPVLDAAGNPVLSIGLPVHYVFISATEIQGQTFADNSQGADRRNVLPRTIFDLTVNADGTFQFILTDQIDHSTHSSDNGTNPQGIFEETLFIDLSAVVLGQDATPDIF